MHKRRHQTLRLCAFLPLDSISHRALKVRTIVSAECELLTVFHDDAVLTVKPGLHLLDPVDLHDRRTMNAPKLLRVELLLQTANRFAEEVPFLVVVDTDVVTFRLNAVHVLNIKKENAAAIFDHEPLEMSGSGLKLFE